MRYFADYALDPQSAGADDSPLYIFDGTFGDRDVSKDLLGDYCVPEYFSEDLFQHVGEDRRPPYRWVVFGPGRSGSSLHIDPLATSAWNALLQARARTCMEVWVSLGRTTHEGFGFTGGFTSDLAFTLSPSFSLRYHDPLTDRPRDPATLPTTHCALRRAIRGGACSRQASRAPTCAPEGSDSTARRCAPPHHAHNTPPHTTPQPLLQPHARRWRVCRFR